MPVPRPTFLAPGQLRMLGLAASPQDLHFLGVARGIVSRFHTPRGAGSSRAPATPSYNPRVTLGLAPQRTTSRKYTLYPRPPAATAAARRTALPPLHAITDTSAVTRRFIGGSAAVPAFIGGGHPARMLLRGFHGRAIGSALRVVMGALGKSMRLPLALLSMAIATLAYIEYKLQQLSAPSWITSGLKGTREWLENLKASVSLFQQHHHHQQQQQETETGGTNDSDGSAALPQKPVVELRRFSDGNEEQHTDNDDGNSWDGSSNGSGGGGGDYYYGVADQDGDSSGEARPGGKHRPPAGEGNVLMDLTKRLIEVQHILESIKPTPEKASLRLPSIVVIGSQSSGKSSVLEAIVGQGFLPKGSNMVTRRPIELTLVNTPGSDQAYGEFPQLGLDRVTDFEQIQRTLYDLNMSVPESECVSDKPIDLRIYSPTVPDLRLVDLPGYIQVTHRKQPSELKQRIRDLCERYLKQPNIILAVSPADVDLANSEALLAGRRNDPMGLRTLGIITKVDMVDPSDAVRILTQNDYPLHLGYVGVMCKAVKGKGSAASGTVTVTESQYFGRHSEFRQPDVSVGVDTLRRRLVAILEESMSRNLGRLVEAVQNELEETRYQVKVQYNDQRVTAESYVADTLDAIKQKFKQFTHDFGKPQVRAKVRSLLESRMLDICAELYWSDSGVVAFSKRATQSGSVWWWSSAVSGTKVAIGNVASLMHILALGNGSNSSTLKAPSSPQPPSSADGAQAIDGKGNSGSEWSDDVSLYWDHRLDKAASILTKSGVGRWTTQMVVDLLLGKVETMVSGEPFTYHPNARQAILDFSQEILRGKYHATIDQVENTIKPFKYEVEVEPFEWDKAVSRTRELIDNEIELCRAAIKRIRSLAPKKQLAEAIKIVNASNNGGGSGGKAYATQTLPSSMQPDGGTISSVAGDGDEPQTDAGAMTLPSFSPKLLSQARAIISLRDRLAILRLRRQAIVSDTCKSVHNKALCPEIFLEVVAEKLTYNAALFINFELLHEFFFQFPRVLDSQIYYAQSPRQAREFANQNPVVRQHLELLDRQRKLEEALAQLRDLMRLQEQQAERGKYASSRRRWPS